MAVSPAPGDPTPALARASGCSVRFDPATGDWYVCGCGGDTVVALTDRLASYDAQTLERVQAMASALRANDAESTARAMHDFVVNAVRWQPDQVQRLRRATSTIDMRAGNCVSKTRLLLALARAAGLGGRAVPVVNRAGDVVHVAPQLLVGGDWQWVDVSLASQFGENPYDASARLRVERQELLR